jgi:hypothetical protein
MAFPSLAEVVNDPELAEDGGFTILRSTTSYGAGGIQSTTTAIASYGVIDNPAGNILQQLPEADRIEGSIAVHTEAVIYETQDDEGTNANQTGVSDIIVWHGLQWMVNHVFDRGNRGYYSAVCSRMRGN